MFFIGFALGCADISSSRNEQTSISKKRQVFVPEPDLPRSEDTRASAQNSNALAPCASQAEQLSLAGLHQAKIIPMPWVVADLSRYAPI